MEIRDYEQYMKDRIIRQLEIDSINDAQEISDLRRRLKITSNQCNDAYNERYDLREQVGSLERSLAVVNDQKKVVEEELERLKRQPDLSELTKWVKVLTEQLNVIEEKQTITRQYEVWDRGDVKLNLTFHNRSRDEKGVELLLHQVEKLFGDDGWALIDFEAAK